MDQNNEPILHVSSHHLRQKTAFKKGTQTSYDPLFFLFCIFHKSSIVERIQIAEHISLVLPSNFVLEKLGGISNIQVNNAHYFSPFKGFLRLFCFRQNAAETNNYSFYKLETLFEQERDRTSSNDCFQLTFDAICNILEYLDGPSLVNLCIANLFKSVILSNPKSVRKLRSFQNHLFCRSFVAESDIFMYCCVTPIMAHDEHFFFAMDTHKIEFFSILKSSKLFSKIPLFCNVITLFQFIFCSFEKYEKYPRREKRFLQLMLRKYQTCNDFCTCRNLPDYLTKMVSSYTH